jgi:hypothetical protein
MTNKNAVEITIKRNGTSVIINTTSGKAATFDKTMTDALMKRDEIERGQVATSWIGMAHSKAPMFRITAKKSGVVAL